MTRILVPISHAPGFEAVIDHACAFAKGTGGSLTLMHVFEPPNEMVGIVPGATVAGELAADEASSKDLLERADERVRAAGLPTPARILERASSPSAAILAHARDFDLVVMGTHGRKGIRRMLLGSVTEAVLRAAPCPVLTIHVP